MSQSEQYSVLGCMLLLSFLFFGFWIGYFLEIDREKRKHPYVVLEPPRIIIDIGFVNEK